MNHKKNQTIKDLLRAAATPAEWKDEGEGALWGALWPPGIHTPSLSELIKRRTALLQELSEVQKLINLMEKK